MQICTASSISPNRTLKLMKTASRKKRRKKNEEKYASVLSEKPTSNLAVLKCSSKTLYFKSEGYS